MTQMVPRCDFSEIVYAVYPELRLFDPNATGEEGQTIRERLKQMETSRSGQTQSSGACWVHKHGSRRTRQTESFLADRSMYGRRSTAKLRIEPGGLSRQMVAFGEVGCQARSVRVEPSRGNQLTVSLVKVRRDGGVAGKGGV